MGKVPGVLSPRLLGMLTRVKRDSELIVSSKGFPTRSVKGSTVIVHYSKRKIPRVLSTVLRIFPLSDCIRRPMGLVRIVPKSAIRAPV